MLLSRYFVLRYVSLSINNSFCKWKKFNKIKSVVAEFIFWFSYSGCKNIFGWVTLLFNKAKCLNIFILACWQSRKRRNDTFKWITSQQRNRYFLLPEQLSKDYSVDHIYKRLVSVFPTHYVNSLCTWQITQSIAHTCRNVLPYLPSRNRRIGQILSVIKKLELVDDEICVNTDIQAAIKALNAPTITLALTLKQVLFWEKHFPIQFFLNFPTFP